MTDMQLPGDPIPRENPESPLPAAGKNKIPPKGGADNNGTSEKDSDKRRTSGTGGDTLRFD